MPLTKWIRVYPERIRELIEKPHHLLVPTIVVISDIRSASDRECSECQAHLEKLIQEIGPNSRNRKVLPSLERNAVHIHMMVHSCLCDAI